MSSCYKIQRLTTANTHTHTHTHTFKVSMLHFSICGCRGREDFLLNCQQLSCLLFTTEKKFDLCPVENWHWFALSISHLWPLWLSQSLSWSRTRAHRISPTAGWGFDWPRTGPSVMSPSMRSNRWTLFTAAIYWSPFLIYEGEKKSCFCKS